MKTLLSLSAAALLAASAYAQPASPPATASVTLDGKAVSIKYSAPSMRGRKIFGGLVPHGQVWRAGANAATTLTTEADLDIAGLAVPKGTYTLYILPDEKSWTLIVNKQTGQWGTVYQEGQDLGRTKLTLSAAPSPVETYKINLTGSGKTGKLTFEWESAVATAAITAK